MAIIKTPASCRGLQEAVEAPRIWTEGNALELELAVPNGVRAQLASMGHKLVAVPTVAGGMNAIEFNDDGQPRGLHVGAPTARRSALPVDWHGQE